MINSRIRSQLRLQSVLFILLFLGALGLLAWLSQLNPLIIDLTANQRNSLSSESIRLVKSLQHPLEITIFASPIKNKHEVLEHLFQSYQREQSLVSYHSLNPDLNPALLRKYDIRGDGEIVIEYQGRSEKISHVNEQQVTNSIQRLIREGERWVVFLQGHGERNPYSEANHDLSLFASQLASKGYTIENISLTQTNSIPDNTIVLVIASPAVSLLPGEVELIQDYLGSGGNLLWLADPDQTINGLEPVADMLAVEFLPGIIVDPNSQLLGLDGVDFALVNSYPRHPVTQGLDSISIFPQALALEFHGEAGIWKRHNFLRSGESSWTETGKMDGDIFYGDNDDEVNGPLTIGLTMTADYQNEENLTSIQRIAVIGDSDFLSNRYLGSGANLEIGVNLLNWLSHDDNLIAINPRAAPDTQLDLSKIQQIFIGFGFLVFMPVLLFGCGLAVWLKRRNQ